MDRRGFGSLVIILVVILVAAVAIGGIWYYKSQQSGSYQSATTQASTTVQSESQTSASTQAKNASIIAACDNAILDGDTTSSRESAAQQAEIDVLLVPLTKTYGIYLGIAPLVSRGQVYFANRGSYTATPGGPYYYALYRATTTDVLKNVAQPVLVTGLPDLQKESIAKITVSGQTLVYAAGGDVNAVYAVDVRTGQQLWEATSTAIQIPEMSDSSIYLTGASGLVRVNPETGEVMWRFKEGTSIPFFVGDTVYVDGGVSTSGVQLASGSNIYTLDATTGQTLTAIPVNFDVVQAWDQCGGSIYFERGSLTAASVGRFDPNSGEVSYVGSTKN